MATDAVPPMEPIIGGSSSPQHENMEPTSARHSKRLSLNFPILPPNSAPQSGRGSPSPRTPQCDPFTQLKVPAVPTTSSGFLTALAGQERRVLELREELQRAEVELMTLKKQWASHEAKKKRMGNFDSAQLHSVVRADISRTDRELVEESMELSLLSREKENKLASKADTKPDTKTRPRKVFSGSRSTRTLSLLSPNAANNLSFPQPKDIDAGETEPNASSAEMSKPALSRSSTISASHDADVIPLPAVSHDLAPKRRSMPPPSREALLRTSKQMASDFREGLWTFFEDLRQATVGEEGVNGTESRAIQVQSISKSKSPRTRNEKSATPKSVEKDLAAAYRVGSSASKASSILGSGDGRQSAIGDVGSDFWNEFGLQQKFPSPNRPHSSRLGLDLGSKPQTQIKADVSDNWDIWDSPVPVMKGSPASIETGITQRTSSSRAVSPQATSPNMIVTKRGPERTMSVAGSVLSPSREHFIADRPKPSTPNNDRQQEAIQWPLSG